MFSPCARSWEFWVVRHPFKLFFNFKEYYGFYEQVSTGYVLKSKSQRLNDTEAQCSYNVYIYIVWVLFSMNFHTFYVFLLLRLQLKLFFCFVLRNQELKLFERACSASHLHNQMRHDTKNIILLFSSFFLKRFNFENKFNFPYTGILMFWIH